METEYPLWYYALAGVSVTGTIVSIAIDNYRQKRKSKKTDSSQIREKPSKLPDLTENS
ncbi:hypothetical protein JXA48_05300 [Candidatus Woesearchaeota archaeon]|nr:hypothetical protein [Candidatus Woesearchaeota archaeon]